jgi:hypothetical protein
MVAMSANRFMNGTSANGEGATPVHTAAAPREHHLSIAVPTISATALRA